MNLSSPAAIGTELPHSHFIPPLEREEAGSILFLSDLHLSPQQLLLTRCFEAFCAGSAREATAVYILGDLFDYWLGDDQLREPYYQEVARHLAGIEAAGGSVFLQHGNRDFLIGERFAREARVTLLPDPCALDFYGVRTVLTHGDALCTDDADYQAARRFWRTPSRIRQYLALPLFLRRWMAGHFRRRSMNKAQSKTDYQTDVNQDAVAACLLEHDANRMIHGHTHRPDTYHFDLHGRERERIVLPDWRTGGPYLELSKAGCRVLEIKEN
ncbi:MAG: UDP-2,3-diacylglucosamine diphosphatase [Burkholderiales bacterium]|jgi:UDP-2,3-diacylglucosamine hydrolase|nr:UDP-2,3-diacylglucosamine diphosphatase [Burkholderiales bacterium]